MRTMAMVKRIFRQMFRDKRTMALLFVAPLFILTLMYLVFNGEQADPVVGTENANERFIEKLKDANIKVKEFADVTDEQDLVVEEQLDGFLQMGGDIPKLTLRNNDPSTSQALQMKVKQITNALQMSKQLQKNVDMEENTSLDIAYVYGDEDTVFFDVLGPILIGFFVFFFVFLISGIGLLKERTTGTLERLMATPVKRGEIVASYLIGFGTFAVLQTIIIVLYAVSILEIVLIGSVWNVLLINLLLAMVALSLGILLSAFAESEFQMMQFIPIIVVPQIFFSGIIPLEGMADWLQVLAKGMPLFYAADALQDVMYKGLGLADITGDLYVLILFAVVLIILNLFGLKKYRKL
ncbi:ABC transporter permease [Virgibacillus pantothenticus]|uniref:ABC transporter permease n=1 Tax=Virgibacillus pantothenticus TaxID=1473 RepID=UPI001B1EA959|nr:ABC transporter permease [Virgibacillus pantothenticus]MBU8567777.1 ABC transporter permease [Virgibacillus pantothenticus]MBU8601570.1 ABC transporter permease [Virgibacillus pantothenticus]MBU8635799.1 ABC transporter permease [Virgibacillus pantothenticus]MBU8643505.1 ABC transporter permease [Virgibacillus pantothenticus]MBU8647625.1 ABC transporter permease [Virgibacillus pantothenticus]